MTTNNLPENFTPAEMTVSKLRFYSIGIVAMNKLLDSNTIEVTPVEDLPMIDGNINSQASEFKTKGTDSNGNAYEANMAITTTVSADWLPLSVSNRITSPDVRRGEMVMIYQFGDADKYYWATIKQDINLRKLETVIYAFSGTTDENVKSSSTTTYYMQVSTHKKLVSLHTSKVNGEPFIYDIKINTKDGIITIADDVGNFFSLDSTNRRLELKNIDGSHIDVNKEDIVITSTNSITLKTNKLIEESTTHTVTNSDMTVNSSGSIHMVSPDTNVD